MKNRPILGVDGSYFLEEEYNNNNNGSNGHLNVLPKEEHHHHHHHHYNFVSFDEKSSFKIVFLLWNVVIVRSKTIRLAKSLYAHLLSTPDGQYVALGGPINR